MNVHDYATRLDAIDRAVGRTTTAPESVAVCLDMLKAAKTVGGYDAVREAAVAVYGEVVTAKAENLLNRKDA